MIKKYTIYSNIKGAFLNDSLILDKAEFFAKELSEKLIAIEEQESGCLVVHDSLNKAEMLLKLRKIENYFLENIENDKDGEFINSIRRYKENIKNSNKRQMQV